MVAIDAVEIKTAVQGIMIRMLPSSILPCSYKEAMHFTFRS